MKNMQLIVLFSMKTSLKNITAKSPCKNQIFILTEKKKAWHCVDSVGLEKLLLIETIMKANQTANTHSSWLLQNTGCSRNISNILNCLFWAESKLRPVVMLVPLS